MIQTRSTAEAERIANALRQAIKPRSNTAMSAQPAAANDPNAAPSGDIILRNVRLSFPDLWHAVEFKPGDGKPRWNATFLIEPGSDNDKAIRRAISAAARAEWGDKAAQIMKSIAGQANKFCYLDGAMKTYDGYDGMWSLAAHRAGLLRSGSTNSAPLIIDRNKRELTDRDGRPYGGCYVNAKVSLWAQKGENTGMRCSFSVVQFHADGDQLGAGAPNASDFEDLSDGADAADFL